MSAELPAAELPYATTEAADLNQQTRRRQTLKWVLIAGAIALPLGWYAYASLLNPQGPAAAPEAGHISATALIAEGDPNDPRLQNEDLAGRLRAAQAELATLQTENVQLRTETQTIAQQRDAQLLDAQRTIDALDRARNAEPRPAALGASLSPQPEPGSGAVAAPLAERAPLRGGSNPFAPLGPDFGPSQPAAAAARPRRSMETVRVTLAGPPVKTGGPTPNMDLASGPGSGGGQAGFFSGTLQTFESRSYVPPNAYAGARVLVGVDAATGTSYSADPKPVLFRITTPARHVGVSGKIQTTELAGCVVNGAAYGELPSEKVYIKLQRITCPSGAGKFSVATVEGYVTYKGKAGVRGNVISREGQFTRRAMVAGALNGLGQGLSTNLNNAVGGTNVVPGGGSGGVGDLLGAQKLTTEEIAQGAVGSGVSGAATMLADYYIKRAEQYQPVIEMPTGIDVEIVFLSGFQVK